jgi:hypothetical protein
MTTSTIPTHDAASDKPLRHGRWIPLLLMVAIALLAGGILWIVVPMDLASRSESEILSGSPIPPPAERSVRECNPAAEFSFDRNAREADLDQAIGPRVEKWERVHGARVRIVGTAKYTFRGGARVTGTCDEHFDIRLIDDSKSGFKWPKEIEDRPVLVEGCLSRIYYPRELQRPDMSKWTDREKQKRSNMRALPFGFVYELRNFTYRLADKSAGLEPEEGAPADGKKR